MTWLLAAVTGVLIGSVPTADWIARLRGIDLRRKGSGNPGANNAFRSGGALLGAAVLVVEMSKGAAAVALGASLGGPEAALAGIGATLGNVYNPWYRFRGGKGLGITAGSVLAASPILAGVLVLVIAVSVAVWRRSGPASLLTLAVYVAMAAVGAIIERSMRTGLIGDPASLLAMAAGQTLVMTPKHLADTRRRPS